MKQKYTVFIICNRCKINPRILKVQLAQPTIGPCTSTLHQTCPSPILPHPDRVLCTVLFTIPWVGPLSHQIPFTNIPTPYPYPYSTTPSPLPPTPYPHHLLLPPPYYPTPTMPHPQPPPHLVDSNIY